jgi:hypothetical protein
VAATLEQPGTPGLCYHLSLAHERYCAVSKLSTVTNTIVGHAVSLCGFFAQLCYCVINDGLSGLAATARQGCYRTEERTSLTWAAPHLNQRTTVKWDGDTRLLSEHLTTDTDEGT